MIENLKDTKVKGADLIIGKEYWLDSRKDTSGIFIMRKRFTLRFIRASGTSFIEDIDGYIKFTDDIGYYYPVDNVDDSIKNIDDSIKNFVTEMILTIMIVLFLVALFLVIVFSIESLS